MTTHAGSLPRPDDLVDLMSTPSSEGTIGFERSAASAVSAVVEKQIEAGVDIVSDGEQSKVSFVNYVASRMSGFAPIERSSLAARAKDMSDFPEIAASRKTATFADSRPKVAGAVACVGAIRYGDGRALRMDIEHFRSALQGKAAQEGFLTAVSPGAVAQVVEDRHHGDRRAYLFALADALRVEYRAIVEAGFVLQVDAPDLALARHLEFADAPLGEFRRAIRDNVEALSGAIRDLPTDRMRLHVCWGNYPGPHHHDVALGDIIDIVLDVPVGAISFEAANPRHEHEWKVWRDTTLRPDLVLIPGVIDTRVNYIEHPEVVADRIARYAQIVGRKRVIAGTDCGFSTAVGSVHVFPRVAFAKLRSLAQGARLASQQLF